MDSEPWLTSADESPLYLSSATIRVATNITYLARIAATKVTTVSKPLHACTGEAAVQRCGNRRRRTATRAVAVRDGVTVAADGADERQGEEGHERTCGAPTTVERR